MSQNEDAARIMRAREIHRIGERLKDLWNEIYAPKNKLSLETALSSFEYNARQLFALRTNDARGDDGDK